MYGDTTELHVLQCGNCGVWHAIPKMMFDTCVEEGGFWQCPNGHSRGYREGRRDREAVRRERDQLKQRLAQKDDEITRQRELREAAERSASARKGQITKLKKRATAGLCPCCNRSFQNLHRHMTSQHPKYMAEEVE
ncbi:hypothetical protein [Mesorhizobium sp. Z1-4]|uniref:hypothetical protein n=1 Tax=Mesorhizobium sp. Z1-4 TaxID=2448478 RepID=UPI000FD98638|nr:hypothetical protein [Mesorhizobium sp. Z1-4]